MSQVTFKGNPMTLVGKEVKVGDHAPDFKVRKGLGADSEYTHLSDAGKVRLVIVVPSLDTGICDKETRTFNERAAELSDDVVLLTVSMDLPTAQGRWCGAAGVDRIVTASDYYDHSFGNAFGVRVKELGVLARCIFVIDKSGKIAYKQLVPEIASEPNYDEALEAVKAASG
jgi:thiol peroxidase